MRTYVLEKQAPNSDHVVYKHVNNDVSVDFHTVYVAETNKYWFDDTMLEGCEPAQGVTPFDVVYDTLCIRLGGWT
jgi:hypothetical protein